MSNFCDPMDCSIPGPFVLHYLPEFAQMHVHWVGDATQPWWDGSVTRFSFCPQSFPASESFPVTRLFASGGQTIGASASTSVLAVEIQGCFPLGLTSLISFLSKELLSKSFSAPQFEGISSLALSLFYCPALTSMHDYWKNHSFN